MTDNISKLSAFAAGGTSKIDKNKVDMSARKELAKNGIDFKNDNKLTNDEMKLLKKEFGMNEAQVQEWTAVEGGMEFLNAMLHAEGSTKKEIKANREQIAKQFLLQNRTIDLGSSDRILREQLKEFGVDVNEAADYVRDNWMNKEYPVKTITPDPSTGNTTVENVRLHYPKDINGEVSKKRIDMFDATKNQETLNMNAVDSNPDYKGTLIKDEVTGLYVDYHPVDGSEAKYYKLNGDKGLVSVSKNTYQQMNAAASQPEVNTAENVENAEVATAATPTTEAQATEETTTAAQPAATDTETAANTKATFQNAKSVTIDCTGSRQKLWSQNVKDTGFVVIGKKGYEENGLPKEVAIELPGDYGSKGKDGVRQKRYQHWVLKDAEKGIYSDKAGLRKFQASIDGDGNIKFTQIEINDSKIKKFLNENTEIAAKQSKDKGLNNEQTKMEIRNKEDAKVLINKLADRNQAWETYLQVGTDSGYYTGSLGLLEKLVDEKDVTGIKNYNDLKPAIDGLMARVPESAQDTPEYRAAKAIVDKMAQNPNEDFSTGWWATHISSKNPVRDLDKALQTLGVKHMAGKVQGANHSNNSFLVGGNGAVTIQPEATLGLGGVNSMWKSDAKFSIGGKDYYFYRDVAFLPDKCFDFQDIIGHENSTRKPLITNDITGNNRHGQINFHADRLEEGKTYYFQTSGGAELKVAVDNGVAYITGSNGEKVKVNDVLNGRAQMPS